MGRVKYAACQSKAGEKAECTKQNAFISFVSHTVCSVGAVCQADLVTGIDFGAAVGDDKITVPEIA